jgi:hypothetical protein
MVKKCIKKYKVLISLLAISVTINNANAGIYIIKNGETLWSIATSKLNDPNRWNEILLHPSENQVTNPRDIKTGTQLWIPKKIMKPSAKVSKKTKSTNRS